MLDLKNISKTFNPGTVNEKVALENVNLHLDDGDFATIVGSNGAGKSTLFNAIAGEFIADTGTITLDGRDITFLPYFKRSKAIGRINVFFPPASRSFARFFKEATIEIRSVSISASTTNRRDALIRGRQQSARMPDTQSSNKIRKPYSCGPFEQTRESRHTHSGLMSGQIQANFTAQMR